ncbi:MAG TPA: pitrilysin family protein [Candidatus Binatia bacterium]|nr:pitrilysin family protein [Candidatus Binatia bacterium]
MHYVLRAVAAGLLTLGLLAGSAAGINGAAPAILDATLRNGLRVIIVRNAIAPVVSTDLVYLVGSRDDPAQFTGMAHAQEHMMYRGTSNLSSSELETIATALGGSFNAQTRDTLTEFQFTVPAANLDAILRIESDRMRDVLDAQAQWADERGAIEQEVARDDSIPGNDFFRDAQAIAFAGTSYARDGVGTKASFDRLTGPQIKAFYNKWYAPNNAVLVIAGAVDPQAALAQVRARFEAIPKKPIPEHQRAKFLPLKRTVIRRESSLIYPLAAIGFRMPGINSPDFVTSYVLQGILDAQRGPLHALAAGGEALDGEWVAMPYFPEGQLCFAIAALNPGSNPDQMLPRLQSILTGYAQHGVPRELFESTKRRLIASQEFGRNSISQLASDWADTIALDGEPTIAREQQLIAAVTLADVNRIAARYLDVKSAIIGALTPSANASSSRAPAPSQQGPENPLQSRAPSFRVPSWANGIVHDVRVPAAGTPLAQMKLPNGITLIVQPEAISNSVFVFGSVKTIPVLQEPPGRDGVANILGALFEYGTATADRATFQRQLDDADAMEIGGPDFRLQATPQNFERSVSLLASNVLQPRFDSATFEIARRRVAADLATTYSGTHSIAVKQAAQKLLPAGDPELREPSIPTVASLTLDDVKSYYAKTFRPDVTTIVVIGNVTPQRARAAIESSFGSWRAGGAPPNLELAPLPLNAGGRVHVPIPSVQQDDVTLEQIVTARRSDPAYYPLQLGNAVLGGGAGGPELSRLFRDLRQNSGLVYFVSSRFAMGPTRSRFVIRFASAPPNESRIESIIDSNIAKMQAEPVGDDELALIKASVVRRAVVGGAAIDAIGNSLLDYATTGLPLDQSRIDAERFLATDASAVRSAFATYVKPQNFVRTIEGP